MIKKILAIFLLAAAAACTDWSSQLAQLEQRTAGLRDEAAQYNATSLALSELLDAVNRGTCVRTFVPVAGPEGETAGFIIFFEDGSKVTVAGTMCNASLVCESGDYYWKIDGKTIPVSADNPSLQFRMEDGLLCYSADAGASWSPAGNVPSPVFSGISEDASSVTLTLADGTPVVLPKVQQASIQLRCDYGSVAVGDSLGIGVTLSGFPSGAEVLAVLPDGWTSRVEMQGLSGKVVVKPSDGASAGDVIVFASDGMGRSIASSVSLGVNQEVAPVDTLLTVMHDAYQVGGAGGAFDVHVSTNVRYEISVSDSWIGAAATKGVREDVIQFYAGPNEDPWPRAATISFKSGSYIQNVIVVQEGCVSNVVDAEDSGYITLVKTSKHNVVLDRDDYYEFGITTSGSDPYVYTEQLQNNLHSDLAMVTFEYKCDQTVNSVQLFFGDPVTAERSLNVGNLAASSDWKSVSVYIWPMRDRYFWGDAGDRMRIDPGDVSGVYIQIRNIHFRAMTDSERRKYANDRIELRSDRLRVMQDLTCGGAISYISKAGSTWNYVNICDKGRYIQQSYYAGRSLNLLSQGQSPDWSPWQWNPIQVGDYKGHKSKILDYESTENTSYVKCIPLRWDMDNVPAKAVMEQWTSLSGNILTVRNKITLDRDEDDGFGIAVCAQELPAVYPIAELNHLYAYIGSHPFTDKAEPREIPVVNLSSGFWGIYAGTTEKWMAFLGDDGYGMAVYNPSAHQILAGRAGNAWGDCYSSSTSYIAPEASAKLPYKGEYEYTYYLIMGNLEEIRSAVYHLHDMGY